MRKKVTIVGAGQVGATTAQRIFEKQYADIVIIDIIIAEIVFVIASTIFTQIFVSI